MPIDRPRALAPHPDVVSSPSELAAAGASLDPSARRRVGGRVVAVGVGRVRLADAFGALEVATRAEWPVDPGDLVLCELAPTVPASDAVLLERHRPIATRMTGALPHPLGAAIRARAALLASVRRFFAERGFVEVDTPSVVRSPGLDVHLDGFAVEGGMAGAPAYLVTSPEYQMKRLLAAGVPRLYQIGHCFRRGEVGDRHNPEFTMVEWYRAFAGMEEVMADTEALVREGLAALGATHEVRFEGRTIALERPFARATVAELFREHAADVTLDPSALAEQDEERYFRAWVERIEPAVAARPAPLFVTDFPAAQASLARLRPTDPRYCERFELYAGGLELCNGFGELRDAVEQRARLERDRRRRGELGLPRYPIDERFLAALADGMPPAGGNALGLDRLLMLGLGAESIALVQAFPAERL